MVPSLHKDVSHLESVQWHAAQWVSGSRWNTTSHMWSKSSDSCINQLKYYSGLLSILDLEDLFLLFAWLMIFCTREFPFHSSEIFNFLLSLDHIHCHYQFLRCLLILTISLSSLTLFLWSTIPIHILQLSNCDRILENHPYGHAWNN